VTANGRSFEPRGPLALPPRTASLEIDFTALEFFSPRQVQFRYQLDGLEDTWTDAGTRRQVTYTNLRPGTYRFRAIARSSEGVWTEQGAALEFSIEPMFHQTRWFLGCGALVLLGGVLAGWRLRLRQVRRRFALVLAERARVAREIHDTLLQSLAGLELQVDAMSSQLDASSAAVKLQLDRVRRQIQRDVSEARQSIWDLRSPTLEGHDLADALRELGDRVAGAGRVRFEFRLSGKPAPRPRKVEEHVLRIGQEAVNNAVRHGQASVVRVELVYTDETILMRISDDGRGFDVATVVDGGGGHWGLMTMRERAQAIGGQLRLMSTPGHGTRVEMSAPALSVNS
jgi:signal transduction histidine kinase